MIAPFSVPITAADVTDLRDRLSRTRWPSSSPLPGWTQGSPLSDISGLCAYWASGYDFDAARDRLNRHPQFRTVIDGLGIHFVHVRSARADAVPLLLTHGWPGSIVEFFDVIGPLSQSFHVVVPSLPGYGFSDAPAEAGWGVSRVADAWAELMSRLGYSRFVAQGHDWGTSVSTALGLRHPSRIIGLHLVPPLVAPDPATFDSLTPAEQSALDDLAAAQQGDGYSFVQSTRPQTIGYGLVDSPAALCAWIIEKFHAWTDGDPLTRDQLLDNLMMYWLPGAGASAARMYWESFPEVQAVFRGDGSAAPVVSVPVGCSIFPRENPRPSRRWAERRFTDIRYWNEPARGGHFAAFEQPELFVDEVRACVAALAPSG
ncbi:epoxide hydrolase family protein [Paractinoplanes lichenicola]|uniref:Epoxide hydrolase n=1 Tax=Paractinoplanes lichenicola TaxID=2802976 RepID=A0ABS1VH95_9ACTN|nr:epoxide hydrolase family protein [Actinoplanes lichenicola]MBL7254044.1 epoxide hydrolase [Actinoplanes lichenicola]